MLAYSIIGFALPSTHSNKKRKKLQRKIFIGDIHGCLETFQALLAQINLNKEKDKLFLLGDYIDRGPNSKGVIDAIINLTNEGYNILPIKGNHEQMLISDYNAEVEKGWVDMAEVEFIKSFEIKTLNQLPSKYIDFCNTLPDFILDDDFIAVHAGLNFELKDPLRENDDLIWIRDWYKNIDYKWLKQRIIIHGHTPQTRYEIEEQFRHFKEKQVLNIDCGAFSSKSKIHGLGFLCGFDLTNEKLYFQENIDKNCKF